MEITITLREFRQRLGISQKHAAELVGVTHKTWWSWEANWRGMKPRPLAIKVIQLLPRLVALEHQRQRKNERRRKKVPQNLIRLIV